MKVYRISIFLIDIFTIMLINQKNYLLTRSFKKYPNVGETRQTGIDGSGFVHLLLRPHQSCDGNIEQTASLGSK